MGLKNIHALLSFRFWENLPRGMKLFLLFAFAAGIFFLCWSGIHDPAGPGDFFHRCHMGRLIRHGFDPVDWAHGMRPDVVDFHLPPNFTPHHIDFPWTQSIFVLFGALPSRLSLTLFQAVQGFCLLLCMAISIYYLRTRFHMERLFAAVLVSLFYLLPHVRTDFKTGNVALIVLAGFFILYYGWEKKKIWLEAIGLALLCLKPQTGFLFVLLLLLEKRFLTLILAGIYCFLLSIPCMLYLHKIPWDFLEKMFSVGNQFITQPQILGLFGIFYSPSMQTTIMACNAVAAITMLLFYWYHYPTGDPMLKLLPATVGTIFWSYSRTYHFVFLIIPMLCLAGMLEERKDDPKFFCRAFLLILLIMMPLRESFPIYFILAKFMISIFSVFFIAHYSKISGPHDIPEKTTRCDS